MLENTCITLMDADELETKHGLLCVRQLSFNYR